MLSPGQLLRNSRKTERSGMDAYLHRACRRTICRLTSRVSSAASWVKMSICGTRRGLSGKPRKIIHMAFKLEKLDAVPIVKGQKSRKSILEPARPLETAIVFFVNS